jgi:hypothetical protein
MDTPPPDETGVLVSSYGNAEFSRDVIERFPTLRSELEFNAQLLHPQMGALAAAIRDAIASGDTRLPLQVCAFLDEALRKPNAISEIENAVAISFLEAHELRQTATGKTLLERMPESIRSILLEQERRHGVW